MLMNNRDFSVLVGKTIEAVDSESHNSLQLSFTDGSVYQVMTEERHCGIEVFTIEEVAATGRELNVYRIKNDVYGNPRYVLDYRDLLSRSESRSCREDGYDLAAQRSKAFGGSKYRGKNFRYGIVFSSYSVEEIIPFVNKYLLEEEKCSSVNATSL